MAISDADSKLLWGRAAGICSNPGCRQDLTIILDKGNGYNIGEMAHVIAKKPGGPRGIPQGGDDTYVNLVLLCPSCHRTIDKAPDGEFPENLLFTWKQEHESNIRNQGIEETYNDVEELKLRVRRLLTENRILWRDLGPHSNTASNDPGSNLFIVWNLRKLDTLIPNNTRIINVVESNSDLLSEDEFEVFLEFKNHARAFELHQYDRISEYPGFPDNFEQIFSL